MIVGAVTLTVAGDEVALQPGDAASFRGDLVHGYRNDGTGEARFALTVYEPSEGRR